MVDLLTIGAGIGLSIVMWTIGFISGHARGKMEAYEEQYGPNSGDNER